MPTATQRTAMRAERSANRAAIVAAAEAALRERPFRDVSIDELMRDAGVGRTQFYRYFDDLFDLVLTVTRTVFEDLLASHEALLEVSELTEDNLRAGLGAAVDAFAAHGPLVRAVLEAAVHDEAVEAVVAGVHERYIELTERLVRRGAAVADPHQTARWLHFANVAYLTDTFGREPKAERAVALDTIAALWFAALSP